MSLLGLFDAIEHWTTEELDQLRSELAQSIADIDDGVPVPGMFCGDRLAARDVFEAVLEDLSELTPAQLERGRSQMREELEFAETLWPCGQ